MSTASIPSLRLTEPITQPLPTVDWAQTLCDFFSTRFSVWDRSGNLLQSGDHPALRDDTATAELLCAVAQCDTPEIMAESAGVALLAIPWREQVAMGAFLTTDFAEPMRAAATFFEDSAVVRKWAATQTRWQLEHLRRLAESTRGHATQVARAGRFEQEVESMSANLSSTYEEISLLYAVSQQLRVSRTEDELARLAMQRLEECVAAKLLVIQLLPSSLPDQSDVANRDRPRFLTLGEDLITHDRFNELVDQLEIRDGDGPFVANRTLTDSTAWTFPEIRELVLVPLADDAGRFGWVAAINHQQDGEFGTVEANLISSVAAMLAIHGSNRSLFREQAEFVENVVRALVSAIDAKDPYTSGHSDRVARFAVRIALELRCDSKQLNTLYMGGLLHDVGKIGIEDSVLRKTGRLSEAEFEHIKLHPEFGCKILAGLKQLSDILPAVLHHHERWDGLGYPHGLAGDAIPEIARIMAVADAYDAMTSDRPYRQGLSDEKVDGILRDGAEKQWDSRVLDAFFAAKPDILAIANRNRKQLDSIEEQWI